MSDWSKAQSIIHYDLKLKPGFWQRLPHLLFALGLDDEVETRELGRRAVGLYTFAEHVEKRYLAGAVFRSVPSRA